MSGGLDLQYYLSVVKRRLALFLVPFFLILATGVAVSLLLPKLYYSSAVLLVESPQIADSFVRSTVPEVANARIEILKQRVISRDHLLSVIEKLEIYGRHKELSRSQKVDRMRDNINFNLVDIGLDMTTAPSDKGETKKVNTNHDHLGVAFSIGFTSESPNEAAKVANELVTLVLEEDVRNRSSSASVTTKFLSKEADRAAAELAKVDSAIADFKDKNADTLPERLQYNLGLIERQNREIEDLNRAIAAAPDQKRLIEIEANSRQLNQNGPVPGESVASTLDRQISKLQQDLVQQSSIYSDSHPEIRALRTQIAALQKARTQLVTDDTKTDATKTDATKVKLTSDQALLAQKLDAIDQTVNSATKRIATLRQSIDKLQAYAQATPAITAEIESLERKRSAMQSSFDDIQTKFGQARLGEQLEVSQQGEKFTVIQSPEIPTEPVSSKRTLIALGSLGGALATGFGAAFAGEMLDSTIWRSADIIQKLPNTHILVSIPYILTKSELSRKRIKVLNWGVAILAIIFAVVAVVHFWVTPLDLLYYTLLQRL